MVIFIRHDRDFHMTDDVVSRWVSHRVWDAWLKGTGYYTGRRIFVKGATA